MIPFFRRNGRLVLVGIAVSLFCLALSELFAAQIAVPTGSWGLSFRAEGQPPVGNATAQALRQYDAAYIGDGREKVIYLTFDAGYENGNTAKILDVLKARGVPAAFFVVGNYLQTSPELVRRMADEGHLVGNHTEHHWDMSRIADEETFRQELASVEARYREITGQEMEKYYRPPQGVYSEENLKLAQALGYRTVFWSLAYVDWYQDDRRAGLFKAPSAHPSGRGRAAAQHVKDERRHSRRAAQPLGGARLPLRAAGGAVFRYSLTRGRHRSPPPA